MFVTVPKKEYFVAREQDTHYYSTTIMQRLPKSTIIILHKDKFIFDINRESSITIEAEALQHPINSPKPDFYYLETVHKKILENLKERFRVNLN